MGITLTSNFDVNAALPLDSRMVVADLTARDAIAAGRRYLGMCVYVVSDTLTYQLKAGILNADWVEYGGGAGAAITFVDQFSGDGVTTTFPLGADPLAVENTQVYIDGVYQQKLDSYDLVGTDIVFVDPPAVGASNIEVVYTTPASPLVIPNGAITTAKLGDDAVTTVKILDDAVTTPKIADNAVTTAKILSLDAAKLTGTLPPAVFSIADNSISEDNLYVKPITTSATINYSYVGGSSLVQDVTNGTLVVNRNAANSSKRLMITLVPADTSIASFVNTTGALTTYIIRVTRNGTSLGAFSIVPNSIRMVPSSFIWYDQATNTSTTYQLQIQGAAVINVTNVQLAWSYI